MAEEKDKEPVAQYLTAQSRYENLTTERQPFLQRARDVAAVTIPALMPPEGATGTTELPQPYQSVGARGVNNLAAKILMALFPPASAFFRLQLDEKVMDELKAQAQGEDVEGSTSKALAKAERAVMKRLNAGNTRAMLFETGQHLVACGNGLLQVLPEGGLKFYPLSRYVVKRDLEGTPCLIITKESLARETLPPAAYAVVERHEKDGGYADSATKPLDLYTTLTRKRGGSWRIHQEICGERIPGTEGFYPADKSAWFPLRWNAVAGEDYGRGAGEQNLGDLQSLESLSQSLVDGAAALAKILFMVNEAGVTNREDISDAPNLSVIDGDIRDVGVLRTDKAIDLSVAQQEATKIEQRLAHAFLLTSSIQRQAERVTAEEIRTMAAELEQALGGVYSILAEELQRPLVTRVMFQMMRKGDLPQFPDKSISPQIITGLEGLGRSTDTQKLDYLLDGLAQRVGPQAVAEYVNVGAYIERKAAGLNLDIDGVIRSEEEVQAERQRQAQIALAQSLGPKAIDANAKRDVAAQNAESSAQPQ